MPKSQQPRPISRSLTSVALPSSSNINSSPITSREDQAAVLEEMRRNCEELMKVEEQELKNRNGPKNLGDEAIANDTDVHTKTLDSAENENGIVGMRENGLGETKENESMGVFCATTFDDVYCWPRTPADTVVTIPCPQYVQGFKHMSEASRYCTREGSWFKLMGSNKSWTNYSQCSPTMIVVDPDTVLYTVRAEEVDIRMGLWMGLWMGVLMGVGSLDHRRSASAFGLVALVFQPFHIVQFRVPLLPHRLSFLCSSSRPSRSLVRPISLCRTHLCDRRAFSVKIATVAEVPLHPIRHTSHSMLTTTRECTCLARGRRWVSFLAVLILFGKPRCDCTRPAAIKSLRPRETFGARRRERLSALGLGPGLGFIGACSLA
ncbi:Parathyroid hormone/parathyroid hormone-related peptide receptor [Penaeus vannamei]|uniref:Parathyroid hormone/parathyroid hormone-related peptide receptor n=1 Tax=Penaeus vannamei TaxID=6689 RepID=A0A3R7PMR1_PENVA|nr:Parathyroid hormone/parathyroid hormone-related peptide receptor [Penaeus vannamei]